MLFKYLAILALARAGAATVWLGTLSSCLVPSTLMMLTESLIAGVNIGMIVPQYIQSKEFLQLSLTISPASAGFDFGCGTTDGVYTASEVTPPLASQGHSDGVGQMQHFAATYGFNVFRLPVCWQYLVGNTLGATLDANAISVYDELVGACLGTGAYCVIDIHNYARWDNQIVGQSNGAVTNDQLASVWYQMYGHVDLIIRVFRFLTSCAVQRSTRAKQKLSSGS
jgi:aryl-phospho-beta-D-glucosidase BglC (GH1 family)